MRKFNWFFNFEKEEAWLKEKANEGWFLIGTSFGYEFAPGQPQDFTYRIDYRTFKSKTDFQDYVSLFEDSGWHHVAGSRWSGTQYFVRTRPDVSDDIFSDDASKAARYRRSSETWFTLFLVYAVFTVISVSNGSIDPSVYLHPQEWYYTPGLWERTGASFWAGFLFETPFALGRGLFGLILIIVTGIFAYMAIRSFLMGRKSRFR